MNLDIVGYINNRTLPSWPCDKKVHKLHNLELLCTVKDFSNLTKIIYHEPQQIFSQYLQHPEHLELCDFSFTDMTPI